MPRYQYCCEDCNYDDHLKDDIIKEWGEMGFHPETSEFLFIVECKMDDKPKSPKCPRCGGTDTSVSYTDLDLVCYVRGNGIVKDIAGARRDMHRHKLLNEDPYADMRQSGEVDHLSDKFERAGRIIERRTLAAGASIKEQQALRAAEFTDEVMLLDPEFKEVLIFLGNNDGPVNNEDLTKVVNLESDFNKIMSDYNGEYVCYSESGWRLMALGARVAEELIELRALGKV
jgi:hypothetical protein